MSSELLNPWEGVLTCPFCDGQPKVFVNGYITDPGFCRDAVVVCSRCGAGGPTFEPRPEAEITVEVGRRVAIRKWNKRGHAQGAEWKLKRIADVLGSTYPGQGKNVRELPK